MFWLNLYERGLTGLLVVFTALIMRVIFDEEKGKNMERYVKGALTVAAIAFLVTFGVAMLPMLIALFGAVVGVLIGFAPLTIAVVLVVILANTVFKK